MSKKALAIDLDGTLLVGESLSERNRLAVKQAADAGYEIIVATARWRQLAERIGNEIGIEELIIACSGAQVYSMHESRDIYDVRLPEEFVAELFNICNEHRCIASATLNAHTWLKVDPEPSAEYLSEELRWVQALPHDPDELPRIATVQGTDTIALVRELQESRFVDEVNIFDSIGPTGRVVVTITATGADKGIALTKTCEHLSIDPENVIAFGDAHNDIEMFKIAGSSVAMGQAGDDVKEAATHVTAPHTEDGVAAFIEKELL